MTLSRLLIAILATAALPQLAHAEGGLPGSPHAVKENPAASTTLSPGAGSIETATQGAGPGGAIFSPFSEPAIGRAPQQQRLIERDSQGGSPDSTLALVVAAAGIAAIAWLFLRLL